MTTRPYWESHRYSRSAHYPRWISFPLLLNFNFHVEHHYFQDLPWYQLERLSTKLRPMLGDSYVATPLTRWCIANRRRPFDDVFFARPDTATPSVGDSSLPKAG